MNEKETLILTPPPLKWYSQEKERESDQKEFQFMDETPETKAFQFED